jgi:NAD(P)-dependent dehydrogenase (short-subunit alcohol dehydrogenase family)
MLLENKNAIVYGAGGAIGGAVARAFARAGARVFLAGRSPGPVTALAGEITAKGGRAEAGHADVLDAASVEEHFGNVTARAGAVDVSFNAFGLPQRGVQGIPLAELTPDAFAAPVTAYATAFFVTATAAARHMAGRGSGAILTLTASPARLAAPLVGGMAPAWAAVEALTRDLAAEVGPRGVRVLGLRPDGIPGTPTLAEVYGLHAAARGTTPAEIRAFFDARTSLGRQPTLTEVAEVAAFLVSDRASGLTGTIVNLSCGSIVD